MSTLDLENPTPLPGDKLRDMVGNLLAVRYGRPRREEMVAGKKVDLVFEKLELGKRVTLFVETKDYAHNLSREELSRIWSDYDPVVRSRPPASLLVVSRNGLTSQGQAYVDSHEVLRHQTIWQIENEVFGLTDYVRHLETAFDEEGLSRYYVPGRASLIGYAGNVRSSANLEQPLFETLQHWLDSDDYRPVALLGGYGAGKSSFAKRIISAQAAKALTDPLARRPILIRLGDMARSSSLAGLLGAKFANDFPIDGFNVQNFLRLSDRGRLLMVLDGFDEMKHAMTWADFRTQIQSLNRLTHGKAKVILLGRPSAFTSTEEHFHVLRGLKAIGETYRKLPDWPEFIEYELEPFDLKERATFVAGYLSVLSERARSDLSAIQLSTRAAEVNRIADKDPEVFSKPVHAKIFTDLASDANVDLTPFVNGVSRWALYETFFNSLAEREAEKEARRPIGEEDRLTFLRELAFWLWSEKGGATAFNALDVPDRLIETLPHGDAVDPEAAKREYLTGAFLEKKADNVYYFGHRSFAEFLVAKRLALIPPQPRDHAVYSALVRDGVEIFLRESPHKDLLKTWVSTLSTATGMIHLGYLRFLAGLHGGPLGLRARLSPGTPIEVLVGAFGNDIKLDLHARPGLLTALRDPRDAVFFPALELLQMLVAETNVWTKRQMGAEVAAALLDRVFENAELDVGTGRAQINERAEDARRLALASLSELTDTFGDRRMTIQTERLYRLQGEHHRKGGLQILQSDLAAVRPLSSEDDFAWSEVLRAVRAPNHARIASYFQRNRTLSGVFVSRQTSGLGPRRERPARAT